MLDVTYTPASLPVTSGDVLLVIILFTAIHTSNTVGLNLRLRGPPNAYFSSGIMIYSRIFFPIVFKPVIGVIPYTRNINQYFYIRLYIHRTPK